jgi:shikimate kinase
MSNLYVVGFMGAGKSSVGQVLATRLGYRFLDLDAHLVEQFQMTIREVFERLGEERFREAETEALRWTASLERTVVATGGGAFCSEVNRAVIRGSGGRSIFLDVPWRAVEQRLGGDQAERPKYGDPTAARVLYQRRRPHYLAATWTVELDGSEAPEAAADRVLERMAGAVCGT